MKRFSLIAAILVRCLRFQPSRHPSQLPQPYRRFRALWRMRSMSTLLPMTEISSTQIYFPKIGRRSAQSRTPFRSWGKLTLVYQPSQADIIILIILVTSRPSEDVMAVYDGHQGTKGNYLWRVMGRDGLASGETPLVTQFEKGFDSVQKHK